jgi:hypothetical protein
MFNPTTITTILAILTVIAVAAADWYVWGMANGKHNYSPRSIQPLSARELAAKFLVSIRATNAEVLMVPLKEDGPCRC